MFPLTEYSCHGSWTTNQTTVPSVSWDNLNNRQSFGRDDNVSLVHNLPTQYWILSKRQKGKNPAKRYCTKLIPKDVDQKLFEVVASANDCPSDDTGDGEWAFTLKSEGKSAVAEILWLNCKFVVICGSQT